MKYPKKIIIINEVASTLGGGAAILKQILLEIKTNPVANSFNWIIFVSTDIFDKYSFANIQIIKVNLRGWIGRLLWDTFGIKKWLDTRKMKPVLAISLMSVGIKLLDIPQVVYIQQSLPFSGYSDFKKFEWKPFIYNYLIFQWMKFSISKKTNIVVQTQWLKKAVVKKLKIPNEKITILRPSVSQFNIKNTLSLKTQKPKSFTYKLFCPGLPFISYKNYELIIKSIGLLKRNQPGLAKKIRLIFTFKPSPENRLTRYYQKIAIQENVDQNIVWYGQRSIAEMINLYSNSDAILFPSLVESFGLPLIEASSLGKKIFAIDRPYSKDVLKGYKGVSFLGNNTKMWSDSLSNFYSKKENFRFHSHEISNGDWSKFIELIQTLARY